MVKWQMVNVTREVWAFFFFVGVVLFNWPVLDVWKGAHPLYLFCAWGLFIAALAALTSRRGGGGGGQAQ